MRAANGSRRSVSEIVRRYPEGLEGLIPALQDLQEEEGYLSSASLAEISAAVGISENEIYGVASFFTQFRFVPPARHTICVCQGTACHVQGGRQMLHDFEERLKIEAGQQTADHEFGLERVACVGCCALAPVVVVDGEVHARMKPRQVRGLLRKLAGNGSDDG